MLVEAVDVGGLVDAVVVGVDERFSRSHRLADVDNDARHRVPAPVPNSGQMRHRESGALETRGGDHQGPVSEKCRLPLEVAGHDSLAGVASLGGPPEHVEDLPVDIDAIADHAVLPRRNTGRDRGERSGGGGRRNRGDRASGHGRKGRRERGPLLELVPPEPIEHQHDDSRGIDDLRSDHG